jgi:hypothetical protein
MRAPFDPVRHRVRNAGHLRAALSAGWVIRSTYILEKDGHRQAFEGKFWTQLCRGRALLRAARVALVAGYFAAAAALFAFAADDAWREFDGARGVAAEQLGRWP